MKIYKDFDFAEKNQTTVPNVDLAKKASIYYFAQLLVLFGYYFVVSQFFFQLSNLLNITTLQERQISTAFFVFLGFAGWIFVSAAFSSIFYFITNIGILIIIQKRFKIYTGILFLKESTDTNKLSVAISMFCKSVIYLAKYYIPLGLALAFIVYLLAGRSIL